ncbi:hypothetical protein EV360DRAFT_81812 [Lentinula raphanica]|nr:hypothetical protein EV360DRAFT_81812 [Lentinula raphanica]
MSWPPTYFNAVLLLRAVSQTIPYLTQYDHLQGVSYEEIGEANRNLEKVSLREDFKAHFQIVCDQCRSWGNVQTAGPATAMKILCSTSFALNSSSKIVIQRSELAALSNTPNRFSESIQAATRFMSMAQLPAHADPEERIDNNNVRGGFGDDFSATDTYVFQKRIHTRAPYIRIAGAECLRYSSAG